MKLFSPSAFNVIPTHFWTFEEPVGSTLIRDLGRKINNASIVGSLTLGASGLFGKSVQFPGSAGNYVQLPDVANMDFSNEMSVAVWINGFNGPPSSAGQMAILDNTFGTDDTGYQMFWLSGDDSFQFGVVEFGGGAVVNAQSDPHAGTDVWYCVVGTVKYDGSNVTVRIYVDGVLEDETIDAVAIDITASRITRLGETITGAQPVEARIDAFAMWDKELTATEIKNLCKNQNVLPFARNEKRKLFLWNKLNNSASSLKSEIGPGLVEVGSPTYEPGKFGSGVRRDGASDAANHVKFPSNIISKEDISFACWYIRKVDYDGTTSRSILEELSGSDQIVFFLKRSTTVTTDNQIGVVLQTGGSVYSAWHEYADDSAFDTAVPLDTPIHLSFTKRNSDGQVKLYLNNVELSIDNETGSSSNVSGASGNFPMEIFIHGSSGVESANGIVDNPKFYPFVKNDFANFNIEGPAKIFRQDINREIVNAEDSKQIVIWNRLGTSAQVNDSEIGPNMDPGTGTFSQGFFETVSSGAMIFASDDNPGSAPTIPANVLTRKDFTFEFWYQRQEGLSASFDQVFVGESATTNSWIEVYLDTTTDELIFRVRKTAATFYSVKRAFVDLADAEANFPLMTWTHAAFTKRNSDGALNIFINGIQQVVTDNDGSAGNISGDSGFFEEEHKIGHRVGAATGNAIRGDIDNFKYFNFPKIDFSDRFVEGPANVQELVI